MPLLTLKKFIFLADAMYKSAVSMLYDLATIPDPKKGSSQQQFTSFVINFLSSLLTVPVTNCRKFDGLVKFFFRYVCDYSAEALMPLYTKRLRVLFATCSVHWIYSFFGLAFEIFLMRSGSSVCFGLFLFWQNEYF